MHYIFFLFNQYILEIQGIDKLSSGKTFHFLFNANSFICDKDPICLLPIFSQPSATIDHSSSHILTFSLTIQPPPPLFFPLSSYCLIILFLNQTSWEICPQSFNFPACYSFLNMSQPNSTPIKPPRLTLNRNYPQVTQQMFQAQLTSQQHLILLSDPLPFGHTPF